MNIGSIINAAFFSNRWEVAFRKFENGSDAENSPCYPDGIVEYEMMTVPKGYWAADPFVFEKDGNTIVFFEYMNLKKHKAMLACKSIAPKEDKIHIIYEFKGHASYPCIFRHNDDIYIIPETCYDRKIRLLKCDRFPDKWTETAVLKENISAVDSTPVFLNNNWYLFIYELLDDPDRNALSVCKLDLNVVKLSEPLYTEYYSKNQGRPGGHFFHGADSLLRIVQPSESFYGEKLQIFDVKFSETSYCEREIFSINPCNIRCDGKEYDGVHTINRTKEYEVVDLLKQHRFSLFRPFTLCFQKLNLFGYDSCDKKRKYVYKDTPLHLADN